MAAAIIMAAAISFKERVFKEAYAVAASAKRWGEQRKTKRAWVREDWQRISRGSVTLVELIGRGLIPLVEFGTGFVPLVEFNRRLVPLVDFSRGLVPLVELVADLFDPLSHTLTLSHSHTLILSHSHTLILSHSNRGLGERGLVLLVELVTDLFDPVGQTAKDEMGLGSRRLVADW